MEGTGTRWLVTLCLLTAAQCIPSRITSQSEMDSEDSRRVLGSSVVTSVSVIMDHGNGTKTYFADGQSKNVHKPATDTIIGSPGNLLSPDRYEFYTFDDTGDLVKRLMTLDEIHGLIAGADPESVIADTSPTYYHDALSSHSSEALMHLPATELESLDAPAVHRVLESVQNVLKNEMAANSGKPVPTMPPGAQSLHRPDSASAWSALFPGLIETPDDVAHLSGYLLPSKTAGTESTDKLLLLSKKPSATTTKMPPPPSSSQRTQPTTESVRSTPKYTTARPESSTVTTEKTASSTYGSAIASKPPTTKKPFRPVQSFDKQKPTATLLQKPALAVRPSTKRPPPAADGLDINKEMSASISDMLSQVTDSRPVSADHHKPLQTNALLIDKDNAADYVPEESSPELSYYSPVAMALSTAGTSKPVTESLVSAAKRPPPPPTVPNTTPFKTASSTSERPYAQKPTPSVFATTRFGPHKSNATKTRPSGTNVTMTATASYNGGNTAKPFSYSNKFNNGSSSSTVSTTRNNYQYPPSNMSTKYMQKVPQTTQTYPNKLTEHSIKVVNNKTTENATTTPSVKQPAAAASWNFTVDDETKNKYVKEPNKVFQNKVTSGRPNNVNRTNVTLSNRVQESKTTAAPGFSSGFPTTTVRGQTTPEPDKFVSVKVEEWPGTTAGQQQQRPTAATVDPSTSSTPYASTEKSFFTAGNSGQSLQNAITDANTIRDLISSLITKSSTAATVSDISTTTPTTISASTTTTGTSTTTTTTTTTTTSTTASPASTVGTVQQTLTAAASTTVPTIPVKLVTGIPATYISSTTEVPVTTNGSTSSMTAATTAATTTTATAATAETSAVKTSATTTETLTTASKTATTTVASTTPESETQYVPVTHFLPELQVKDSTETEQNNGTPTVQVDSMLKDGISAVANMLQNTQKPPVIQNAAAVQEYQEIGERPYEKVTAADENKSQSLSTVVGEGKTHSSSTEQARKQATVKSDFKDTTAATDGVAFTQEPYELTTATTTTAAESTAKYTAEPTDGVAFESTTTEQLLSRVSEPGLEMMTVFNVSSTGGPTQQAAKLADLSAAETRLSYDATTPFENVPVVSTTDPPAATATEEPTVTTPVAVPVTSTAAATTTSVTTTTTTITSTSTSSTSTTPAPLVEIVPNATVTVATPSIIAHPGPSSNAYRPLISNNASPSTVELHPAPHESMGLEASVAFLGDDVRRFADLCNELSFKMWTAVTGKGQIASRSLVLSPFELTAMLAMVFLGARGSTSGQMNDVLRLDDMVTFNPHQVLRNITHSITNANNPGVATASFVREIYSNKGNGKILEFYKERVQQYYDGHVEEVDFNTIGDVLRRRTNLLVKRQTLGRVVEYLRGSGLSLTPPFAAFSANVFQTSCESASTEGRDGEMYFVVRPSTRQRRLVPVPAAVWRSGFLAGYEPGLDATAVCLSPDSAVSTILVLPGQQGQVAPGDGLTRLEQRLIETSYRRGGWSRILRSLLPRPGLELQVPRFSHRSVLNATAALQKMGLKDVFSDQKADLRGVNGLYDLYLSDMLQVNTFSTCGEDVIGARHHVETYPASPQRMGRVEMLTDRRRRKRHAEDLPLHSPYSHLPLNLRPRQARLPDVPRLRFDRPFLYLVRHNPTGMIVYLGRFNPRLLP